MTIAKEFASRVRKNLGEQTKAVILFGSQARGDAKAGSDYDFVVVVDERTRQVRKLISEVGATLLTEREALCAALVYDAQQWQHLQQSPLGWNIDREGITL